MRGPPCRLSEPALCSAAEGARTLVSKQRAPLRYTAWKVYSAKAFKLPRTARERVQTAELDPNNQLDSSEPVVRAMARPFAPASQVYEFVANVISALRSDGFRGRRW